jgi:tRNA uridine 5-carboxymethylaminomethyl modification enzyme
LILRQANARYRLHGVAQELGIADKHYLAETQRFAAEIASELDRLSKEHYHGASLLQILRRHDTRYTDLPSKRDSLDAEVITQLEIAAKYEGYIRHEEQQVAKLLNAENVKIPDSIDYWSIKTIRRETREKLSQIRPKNLGQASRIPGVSPADIAMLSVIIRAK